jgi:hypothetical protein
LLLKNNYYISFLVIFNIINPYLFSGIIFGGRPFYWGGLLLLFFLFSSNEKIKFNKSYIFPAVFSLLFSFSMFFNFKDLNFFTYGLIFIFSNLISIYFIGKDFFKKNTILKVCKISIVLYMVTLGFVNIMPDSIIFFLRNILINNYYNEIDIIKRSLLSSEPSTAAISLIIIYVLIQLYEESTKQKIIWTLLILILLFYVGSVIGILISLLFLINIIRSNFKFGYKSFTIILLIGWCILEVFSDFIVDLGFDPSDGSRFVFISMSNFFQSFGISSFPQSFDTKVLSKSMDFFISNIVDNGSGLSYIFYEFLNFTTLKPLSVAVFIQLYFGKFFWYFYLLIISHTLLGKHKINLRNFLLIISTLIITIMIQYPILIPLYTVFKPSQK